MRMHTVLKLSALLLAAMLLFFPLAGPTVTAEYRSTGSIEVFAAVVQDLDGDEVPDVAVIDASFATEWDRVLVFDRKGNMQTGSRWEDMTDFQDDVWVFDAGADGDAQLIIAFALEDGNHVAYLYVDEDQDGKVSYELSGKEIRITESPYWRLRVVAQGAWLLPDGRQNPQITMFVDGTTRRLLEGRVALTKGLWDLSTNGNVDWEIESGDRDGDGQADYVLTRLMTYVPDYFSAFRCSLYVDENPRRTLLYANAVFWPLLIGIPGDDAARYFDRPPVIVIDWETGEIEHAGIGGYPAEQGYHILSSAPTWKKGRINNVLWENPLAYYNLAGDQDNWPELLIRLVQPLWLEASPSQPLTPDNIHVEYIWDQNNDGRWDHEVLVAGRKPITDAIDLPDFSVRTVPYEKLPVWVTGQAWDAAFFVVGESGGRADSESLWVWVDALSDFRATYLGGYANAPSPELFEDIVVGYRGEYSLSYTRQPLLYFSPADQRLHLWAAQSGVWNLGEEHYLRYANLNGDAYLDQWQEQRQGTVVQQLNFAHGIYVYGGHDRVQVKRTDVGPALFETKPPRNYEEWQRLDAQLGANQAGFSPEDFTGMLNRLGGVEMQIQGAAVRDYRVMPQGFRFILELQPGFRTVSDPEGWASSLTAAGEYAVSFDGAAWDAQPATPAAPRATELVVGQPGRPLRALDWTTMEVLLENDGLEDAPDLAVGAILTGPAGEREVLTATVTLLPGKGSQAVAWDWVPFTAGAWQICVQVGEESEPGSRPRCQPLPTAGLYVEPRPIPRPGWFLSLASSMPGVIPVFVVATALLAGGAGALWAASRQSGGGR